MSDQEFIFSEFPEIEEDNLVYDHIHRRLRILFKEAVIDLLPRKLVNSLRTYGPLNLYDLETLVGFTQGMRVENETRQIIELCIRASDPLDYEWDGNTPIVILKEFKGFNTSFARIPRFQPHLVKFDGKLYALTRSPECFDSERILELFCTEPAKKIQFAWKNYLDRKRDQASRVIQERVLEWLYRHDGPMMKKSEASFYSISAKQ